MITEHELQAAIAECLGERSPNADTCKKLAAYYTILANLYPENRVSQYSNDPEPIKRVVAESDSEFAEIINGKPEAEVWRILDELMSVIAAIKPSLYEGVLRKLREI